jgi:predicted ATP-dependent endonuclease of OLD family
MFLRRVVLENVRSIEHLELDFGDDEDARRWTFILGENGTGKTTLLRSIALILAGSDALPELLGSAGDWVRFGAKEAQIQADIVTADGEPRTARMSIRRDDTIGSMYSRNANLLSDLDRAFAKSTRNYFTVGYGVSRRPGDEKSTVIQGTSVFTNSRARTVSTLFSSHATLVSVESWAMDLDYREKAAFPGVRDALNRLLPNIELTKIDRKAGELIFQTPDGKMPYRLLSEGYQNVAAWTGDLLFHITNTFGDYRDPFSARGLLLVDEIDLHLHPVWQRQLMQFIGDRFPHLQVVATTHSPLTVHQAGEDELYFLRRPGPNEPADLIPYEGAPRNLMLHQLLTSPAFGVSSLDSVPVEDLKKAYRALRDRPRRSRSDNAKLKQLADEVSDLPNWGDTIEANSEAKEVLEQVQRELTKR